MKRGTHSSISLRAETDTRSASVLEGLRKGLWIAPLIAAFIVLLFLSIGSARFSETGMRFVMAFVYSALIGIPSAILLTWFTIRLEARLGRFMLLVHTLILIFTSILGCFGAGIVFQVAHLVPPGRFWTELRGSYPFALMVTMAVGLGMMTYETARHKLQSALLELRTQQAEQERAYKLLAEARLSSLESRIHPHFLFNTLNSIAALIPIDPRRAEDTVGKLASLLRFSLHGHGSGLVALEQEIRVVRDYLEIEKTRFGSRLRYEIDMPSALADIKTPPLALQCLVENAVKHVIAQRPEGGTIRVTAAQRDDKVHLSVLDDGPGFSLGAITPEHGLGNLIGRLELLFGDRAQLSVSRRDGMTAVSLQHPIE